MMDFTDGLAIHSYDDPVSPLCNPPWELVRTFPKYIAEAEEYFDSWSMQYFRALTWWISFLRVSLNLAFFRRTLRGVSEIHSECIRLGALPDGGKETSPLI
jgi:hypothetical protein